ncbi:MAG: DEAD/DEAH box helicase [Saprospiraceae bacterium]|nr:DEAD/DEAH box helicase [Saprospiraceae bacterium]
MKFEQYHIIKPIKRNLAEAGFKRPTDIQYKAIPSILKKEDVLAIAQTGTGKTAAYVIPSLDLIYKRKVKQTKSARNIYSVVMVPTHELAHQVDAVFKQMGKHTGVVSFALTGGVDQAPQIAQLKKGVDILIATPGRLFDLRSQGYIDLKSIQLLILDEADHMLDLGFIDDIRDLIRYLPKKRQTLFFSATINDKIKRLAYSLVHKPVRIQLSPKNPVSKNVSHQVAFIGMDDKRFFLERIAKEHNEKKILVFVRTKVRAERVCKAMERVGVTAVTMHSDKDHKNRQKVIQDFKNGIQKILIATDVSARGLDVKQVDYVVNYDLPDKAETYVHRIGRTGRGSERGYAISFCSEHEKVYLEQIEEFLGHQVDLLPLDKDEYQNIVDLAENPSRSWKSLIAEQVDLASQHKKVKKGKKKK